MSERTGMTNKLADRLDKLVKTRERLKPFWEMPSSSQLDHDIAYLFDRIDVLTLKLDSAYRHNVKLKALAALDERGDGDARRG